MKVSIIPWHVFWDALGKHNPGALNRWLARWAFADDGVRILMRLQPSREESFGQPVFHRGEIDLTLSTVM